MAPARIAFDAPLGEWKLVFRCLHAHLSEHIELMDADVLESMQTKLQAAAQADGVDVTDHAAWDAWLGNENAPSCTERLAGRGSLN